MDMIMNLENLRNSVINKDKWTIEKVGLEREADIFAFMKYHGHNDFSTCHAVVRSLLHRACYTATVDNTILGVLCLEIIGELAANVIVIAPHMHYAEDVIIKNLLKEVAWDAANNAYKYLILKDVPEDTAFIFEEIGAKEIPV